MNSYNSNYLAEVGGENYFIQGSVEDEIQMWRSTSELLECERDRVQLMMVKHDER